ncbi:MAG: hypothetical protein LBQ30_11050 [Treponema sp.]|jgi:hypothetical protein|nr:hypothetical protein [Treponema sp.]
MKKGREESAGSNLTDRKAYEIDRPGLPHFFAEGIRVSVEYGRTTLA